MNMALILAISLIIIILVVSLTFVYFGQQKLTKERQLFQSILMRKQEEMDNYIKNMNLMHQQEIEQMKQLYSTSTGMPIQRKIFNQIVTTTDTPNEKQAKQIIADAEETAKSIISEAQEQAKRLLQKEEQELQKSIVKVVIQVVKKVLKKTLTYEEHKQIILDSLAEVS